jgi:hypothetical protein
MKFLLLAGFIAVAGSVAITASDVPKLSVHEKSLSSQDLKLSGDLPGLPPKSVRFVSYDELARLPQVTVTVTNDPNFHGRTEIAGVYLDVVLQALDVPDKDTLVSALCDDEYEGHYPVDYREAHHPILVLRINGKPPNQWKRTGEAGTYGPYLISHAAFTPRYHVLAHVEEEQIPNGVLELRFLKEDAVIEAIRPQGNFAADSPEMHGYQIAEQNCLRCHNAGVYGGHRGGFSWSSLAKIAQADPKFFAAYITDPQSQEPYAQMPGSPEYDGATLKALVAYYRLFAPTEAAK